MILHLIRIIGKEYCWEEYEIDDISDVDSVGHQELIKRRGHRMPAKKRGTDDIWLSYSMERKLRLDAFASQWMTIEMRLRV